MFKKLAGKFNKGLGVDLGSTKTMIYQQDRGIVVSESSVVAVNNRTDKILAVGDEARKMLGKTPPHILATTPLDHGIISDFEITEKMLKYFMDKVAAGKFSISAKPKVVVGIPLDLTEVEKKAAEDAILSAGASQVFLVENIMAAAIGARIPIQDPSGNMIVNLGGGLTEVAVISLDGIVNWKSSRTAGLALDRDIIKFARNEFNLVLGEMVAEDIKKKIGSAMPLEEPTQMQMRGRDIMSGLPKEFDVNDSQIRDAMHKSVQHILDTIKLTLETTPPELVADIYQKGIILTGGVAMLKNFDKFIAQGIEIPVHIADDPQTCTVRGMGVIIDDESLLTDIVVPSSQ
jgi:rod shape-determining protein MreB and related proteins